MSLKLRQVTEAEKQNEGRPLKPGQDPQAKAHGLPPDLRAQREAA